LYSYTTTTNIDDLTTTNIDDDDDDDDQDEVTTQLENDLINGKLLKQAKIKQQCNIDTISYDSIINSINKTKTKRPFEVTNDTVLQMTSSASTTMTSTLNGTALINNTTVLNRKLEASLTSLDSCTSTIIGN
jgi:hypothetical protein